MCQSKECCVERHADRIVVFGANQGFWDLTYNGGLQGPLMSTEGKDGILFEPFSFDASDWIARSWANGAD